MRICLFLFLASVTSATAQWTQSNAPRAGYFQAFCEDSGGVLFLGTPDNGVYRSEDGGHSWIEADSGIYNLSEQTDVLSLFATRQGDVFVGVAGLTFNSTDRGVSWHKNAFSQLSDQEPPEAFIETSRGTYLGSATNLYRSTDRGLTWDHTTKGIDTTFDYYNLANGSSNRIYLMGNTQDNRLTRLYVSVDDGASWSLIGNQTSLYWFGFSYYESPRLVIDTFEDGGEVLFLINSQFLGTTLALRSTNRGDTWDSVEMPINASSVVFRKHQLYISETYGNRVFNSADTGRTWRQVSTPCGLTVNFSVLANNPRDRLFDATYGTGVYFADDTTWTLSYQGLPFTLVYGFSFIDQYRVFAGSPVGVWVSDDDGSNWRLFTEDTFPYVMSHRATDQQGRMFAGGSFGLYRSTDGGATWPTRILTENITGLISMSDGSLGISTDTCYYVLPSHDTSVKLIRRGNMRLMSLHKWQGDRALATGVLGQYNSLYRVWEWVPGVIDIPSFTLLTSTGPYSTLLAIDSVFYVPDNNGRLIRVESNGKSTLMKMKGSNIQALCQDSNGCIYAGDAYEGISRSCDGLNWEQCNEGITNGKITSLISTPKGTVLAGSAEQKRFIKGGGVFRLHSNSHVLMTKSSSTPTCILIHRNDLLIAKSSDTNPILTVVSPDGRQSLLAPVNNYSHEYRYDLGQFACGLYFVRSATATFRLLLVR